ncbi:ABC transporter substrate-binding protein [Ferrovibrio sp. MS7]|uniref:ABC transporter substrate-binding protein n=1 Tax=Ferrovibrio plantarum TaxID=3119164 RepID=UPI003135649C
MFRKIDRRQLLTGSTAIAAASLFPMPYLMAQTNFFEPTRVRTTHAPYVSAGPYFIAQAKGYFKKVGLDVTSTSFIDQAQAMPGLAAGEFDITGATISAGLFNLMAKGTPVRLIMEGGRESPGMGSNAILVSNETYAAGFTNLAGYKFAKGRNFGVSTRGAVAQYLHYTALERAGLTPDDVSWQWGLDTRNSLALMPAERVHVINIPLPGAYAAQKRGVGKVVTWSDEIAPNFVLACRAASQKFLAERYSAVVRFIMAILHANAEFNAAAQNGNPEVLKIIAEGTGLEPEVIDECRPRWTQMTPDGIPNVQSIMNQQMFWKDKTDLLARPVPEDSLFDLGAVREAKKRLEDKNPFI